MIEQRLLERLWEEYSALGFDEAFLHGLASSLASSDFVTDENLEQVVADQKPYLERVQQSIDKRVLQSMRDAENGAWRGQHMEPPSHRKSTTEGSHSSPRCNS